MAVEQSCGDEALAQNKATRDNALQRPLNNHPMREYRRLISRFPSALGVCLDGRFKTGSGPKRQACSPEILNFRDGLLQLYSVIGEALVDRFT